ncbi:caspase family protein [Microbacterium sp. B2969]|uniref:Caspase family protein n=1 Tax=Microbacterium alkaliflavum TaxID=3248839 RepID=A0ABW7Q2T0_9MICO
MSTDIDDRPAARAASGLTAAQLLALKPHVITLNDGLLDDKANPKPASVGDFRTTLADLDAIFTTHLPAFLEKQAAGTVPIVLYAHGGLVDAESGFATAQKQVDWWKANGVYPVEFVWKTGIATALADAIMRWISGGARGFFDEAKDRIIEKGARLLGGEGVWRDMKLDAAAASEAAGGARAFAQRLGKWMKEPGRADAVSVHAVGHSAGSIFHSHLIPAALAAGVPRFQTVSFLAPAVRADTFKAKLLPVKDRIGELTIFTMTDKAELDDNCFHAYGRSLLYLVRASFEPAQGTPILGLAKCIAEDDEISGFFAGGKHEVVYSPSKKPVPDDSEALSHGDFDDDPPTMDSVVQRITGLPPKQGFPAKSRDIDLWTTPIEPGADGARGARNPRQALCIGIDEYKREGDRLQGCVADSKLWASELKGAGFDVTPLTNAQATRQNILGSIFSMVTNSVAGDVLVIQYSGHGTRVPDAGGDEPDSFDEAICPVDFRSGQLLIDDDLAQVWDLIPDGVSVTIFFDSCHSGGANRGTDRDGDSLARGVELDSSDIRRYRIARGQLAPTRQEGARDAVVESETKGEKPASADVPRAAREVLFSACRSDQLAWETSGQGDFTKFTAPLLAKSIGKVSNSEFYKAIADGFNAFRQEPQFTSPEGASGALLLGPATAETSGGGDQQPPKTPENDTAGPARSDRNPDARDAALAKILHGLAELLES